MTEPTALAGRLADGEWHRLHPATPLLRGGFALVAILGIVLVNLRDVALELIIGGDNGPPDPLVWVVEHDYALPVLAAIAVGLALFIGGFYLSWRMHTFRITDEVVEVRSGILFRTNRRGRLDRIQGINIVRPFLARLVGAAKLEINVAGQDANVQLAYLGSRASDELRREILALASGTRSAAFGDPAQSLGDPAQSRSGLIEQRVNEFLAPELDPNLAPPQSVVQMHPGRLIGSLVLSGTTITMILFAVASVAVVTLTDNYGILLGFVPALIGLGSFYVRRFSRSLRYSIASTPDGVRVGFGLLSTTNETLPPGRIHAVSVSQPLMWRAFGWWEVRINRAANSSTRGAAGQASTTILPVGNLADTRKVLELVLPSLIDPASLELLERGLTSRGGDDGFVNSPRRAVVLRWFSWRRNGFAVTDDTVLLRRGAIWRELVVVPQARIQSITLHQGPLMRRLRLAAVAIQTVAGPVRTTLGAIDADAAVRFFDDSADAAVRSATNDTSHRWRESGPSPATS